MKLKRLTLWAVICVLALGLTSLWIVGCAGDEPEETLDTTKSSVTTNPPKTDGQVGSIRGTIRFDVKLPKDIKVIAIAINEKTGEEFEVKAEQGKRCLIEDLPPGLYTVTIKEDALESAFSPIGQTGVEVVASDFAVVDALFTTWPYFEAEDATEIDWPMRVDKKDAGAPVCNEPGR